MAYAVFKSGGKQYRAEEGQLVDVDKLDTEVGGTMTFSEVLFVGRGSNFKTGADLEGATVTAEVVEQFKAPKVIAFKYRRRKGYHRTVGHRAKLTRVRITGITA
jgi:large subunit ribosomal protein L21